METSLLQYPQNTTLGETSPGITESRRNGVGPSKGIRQPRGQSLDLEGSIVGPWGDDIETSQRQY